MEEANREMATVVLAGGSGFLGRRISAKLDRLGWKVVILTRDPDAYDGPGLPVEWDGKTLSSGWTQFLEGASAIINLSGKDLNGQLTQANREDVFHSRVHSIRILGEALRKTFRPPPVWIQASSLAIYGDAGDRICDESAYVPGGYPSEHCVGWESELGTAIRPGMRWAILRLGMTLSRDGGALPIFHRLAKLGLGGRFGDGTRWVSWIHEDDAVDLFVEAVRNSRVSGIYNAVGMQPVTNEEFMTELCRILRIPLRLPAPGWLLRLLGPKLTTDPGNALSSCRCLPLRFHRQGFHFRFHNLEDALFDLIEEPESSEDRPYGTVTAPVRGYDCSYVFNKQFICIGRIIAGWSGQWKITHSE